MKSRTLSQNNSLHRYCENLSIKMGDAGFDQRVVMEQFKEGFMVPWTMHSVKNIFRSAGFAMYGAKSTADLTTEEMTKVYRAVDLRISEITGIRCEWPSMESMQIEEQMKGK